MPTARWKHSAVAALVGFGGPRLFARRLAYGAVRYELRGVSPRDERGGAVRRRCTARHSLTHNVNTDTVRTWRFIS
jgi:hypothetical protein